MAVGLHAYIKDGKPYLVNSLGAVRSEGPFLDWLVQQGKWQVAYDLDYFAAVLFKAIELTPEEAKMLKDRETLEISPYKITYFPKRYLSIDIGNFGGHPYCGIYNMEQYFDGGYAPLDTNPTCRMLIERAKAASAKAGEVLAALKSLGMAEKLTSPVSALKSSLLKHFDMPICTDIPGNLGNYVNDMALQSISGSWREVFSMGSFEKVYDYDLSAAYASVLAELYDFRRGEWVEGKEIPHGAVYGFARVVLTIKAEYSPIFLETDETTYAPNGTWERCLPLAELRFIEQYHLGGYRILEGVWWLPTGKKGFDGNLLTTAQYQPMKGIVKNLWDKRENSHGIAKDIIKRGMAGLWGISLETQVRNNKVKYGDNYNPVWGVVGESNTKLLTAKFAMENNLRPLAVAVDGLVSDKAVPAVGTQRGLGEWRLSHTGAAIIGGTNMVAIETKEGQGELSLRYEWLRDAIKSNPGAVEYSIEANGFTSLAEAVTGDYAKLGELKKNAYTVRVKPDGKRYYPKQPHTGGELLAGRYDSMPLTVGDIMSMQKRG